jgi:type IV secretory pathway TrbF-like protein
MYIPQNSTTTSPIIINTSVTQNEGEKKLKNFHIKYCPTDANHTSEIFSFVSAARSVGIDKTLVEEYIIKNIQIAPDSSKANPQKLKTTTPATQLALL